MSDLEADSGSSALPRVELSLLDCDSNTDIENNQGDSELDSRSSASESTSHDDVESDEGEEKDEEEGTVQATRYTKRQRQQSRGSHGRHGRQRTSMPLRDRLRSLRHRRTLNITEQSDYKNVLDCLKVVDPTHTDPDAGVGVGVGDMAAPSRFFNNSNSNKKSAAVASTDSPDTASDGPGIATNSGPGTSKSFVNTRLKSLNEQKRKIELNKDTDNADAGDSVDSVDSVDKGPESQASSSPQKVVFKKFRRKATKQSQNLETEASE